MKKTIYLLLLLLVISLLSGCNSIQNKKKPNTYYYTNSIIENLSSDNISLCSIIESNFKRKLTVNQDDYEVIEKFFYSLKEDNFIAQDKNMDKKPQYKIILEFKKEKYIINIYNDKLLSIQPWDGIYTMDYIDTSSIVNSKNLYYFCKFLNEEIN